MADNFSRVETQALILSEFHEGNYINPQYDNFFKENDLGIPLSVMWMNDVVNLDESMDAWELIEETFISLCKMLGKDPDKNYQDLDDLLES